MKRAALLLFVAFASCSSPPGSAALVEDGEFFARPWPADSRLAMGSDGHKHLDLTGFHDPGGVIGEYIQAAEDAPLDGFGPHAAIYFRFSAPLDPSTLPQTPADSIAASASAFVVDVTPQSPTFRQRTPVIAHFSADANMYIGEDWLALQPDDGFPLRPKTTYAAVITSAARAADGGDVHRASGWAPPPELAAASVDASQVVVATVFTTQDPTPMMKELRDAVYAQAPTPVAANLTFIGTEAKLARYDEYDGTYQSPNFQEGDVPYLRTGGAIHLGSDGKPLVVRTETLRFAVTIPHGAPMPPGGWPVVLYAHGTGGDYRSFIDDGSAGSAALVVDDNNNPIARMAMISIDQVLHGPRDPTMSDPDITFFNVQNIVAARDNAKQGALDDFQLLRLVENMDLAQAPMTNQPIKFDKDRIYFKGHSQGGLTGPLFLAYEPDVKAAVLSGAGADLVLALLGKTEPVNIPQVVGAIVGEDVDRFHPLLNIVQTFLESSDPGNYGRLFFREPPDGQSPKSIYQSLGIVDHYTPIPTIKALSLSMGVQPVNPDLDPITDEPLNWADPPVMQNVANGAATGVLCEYKVPVGMSGQQLYDGHFVVFDDPDAQRQSNAFLASHAATGIASLYK